MPPIDYSNPKVIEFVIENVEKERYKRFCWNEKNKEKIALAAQFTKEPRNYFEKDVYARAISIGMTAISRDHISAGYNRRKVPYRDAISMKRLKDITHPHPIVDIGLANPKDDPRLVRPDTNLSPDPIMRPVAPEVDNMIEKSGRLEYLKERNKTLPDERYYFPETTNWDYGWQIQKKKVPRAKYGSRTVLMNLLRKNRVGPQPDPSYYRDPVKGIYSMCTN